MPTSKWSRLELVRVQLRACRRRAERPGRPRSCRQVRVTWERRSARACLCLFRMSTQPAVAPGGDWKREERDTMRETASGRFQNMLLNGKTICTCNKL
eukprot:COSAG03_NODE_1841_length_3450_cov_2.646673_4_plen_98_part_00